MVLVLDAESIEDVPDAVDGVFVELAGIADSPGYSELLPRIRSELVSLHSGYFARAEDPRGNKWAPLRPSTIERKGHDTILVDTKKLIRSLTTDTGPDAYRDLQDNGDNAFVVFGTSVEYAGSHMTGRENMPARPMVGVNEEFADQIANMVADHVVQRILSGIPG